MPNYIIVDDPVKPTRYWNQHLLSLWTDSRARAYVFNQDQLDSYVLPRGGVWLLVNENPASVKLHAWDCSCGECPEDPTKAEKSTVVAQSSDETLSRVESFISSRGRLRPITSIVEGVEVVHKSDYDALLAERDLLVEALTQIACFDDETANRKLATENTYRWFDEPGSVQAARAALSAVKEKETKDLGEGCESGFSAMRENQRPKRRD